MASLDEEPVPKLPRSSAFKVSTAALVRIVMTAAVLVMIIVAQRPCADAVSGFVTSFDHEGSGSQVQMPKPGNVDLPREVGSAGDYERLRPDMTEAELKAAIERAKLKGKTTEQPQVTPPAGSGSAR